MKKISLIAFFCLFVISAASAQWTTMQYNQYNISFKVPSGFNITANDANSFVASGANFTLGIYPWEDASITEPLDIAQEMYNRMNATDKEVVAEEEVTVSGFQAYKVVGTGMQKGKVLVFAIGGYLDPKSGTNFRVQCLFWYDESTFDVNSEAADYILASFKHIR